jgi:uncharacterized protein YecE (DUF72 family)
VCQREKARKFDAVRNRFFYAAPQRAFRNMNMHPDTCNTASLFIGCAGWSVPSAVGRFFPPEGSHLERYAAVFPAVEINTSFYRPHRPATYAKWRDAVPAGFRFAVKIPKAITHERRLRHAEEALAAFLDEALHLGDKLGCLLLQLPPSLRYDGPAARDFLAFLRSLTDVPLACEARHATWFTQQAADMLREFDAAQVIADPKVAELPASARRAGLAYIRLHGSPKMYYSPYDEAFLDRLEREIRAYLDEGKQVWCVFDNTADGAAQPNALSLLERFRPLPICCPQS